MCVGEDVHIKHRAKKDIKTKEPSMYAVVLLNDDFTTMEFVVEVLCNVFSMNRISAERIMMKIHNTGEGAAGIYTYDIACSKAARVHSMAATRKYPLKCVVRKI